LHGDDFPNVVESNPGWLSERMEGPNIANVFKRTFYQMILKFQIAAHAPCVGAVLAIPASVWDSWQRHLGKPKLRSRKDGTNALVQPGERRKSNTSIFVLDIDGGISGTPNPIRIERVISASANALSYYALQMAADAAVGRANADGWLLSRIQKRLASWWPELQET
jgi:hypothetical protein